jgi:hypothetical protein
MVTSTQAVCPCCRYDVSGAVASWASTCPIEGQCPECGREYHWSTAFAAARNRSLQWLYDLTPVARPGIGRAYLTALHAMVPWSFWRAASRVVTVSPARLLLWPVVLLGPLYAIFLALNVTHLHACHGLYFPPAGGWRLEFLAPFLFDQGETTPSGKTAPLWFPDRFALGMALGGVLPGVMLLALRITRTRMGFRPIHVARVMVYAQTPLIFLFFWQAFAVAVAVDGVFGWIRLTRTFYTVWGQVARVQNWALLLWLLSFWYFAITRGLDPPGLDPPARRCLGATCGLVALLGFALPWLGSWRVWYFEFGAP